MAIDERGFDSEARNLNDLSIEELRLLVGEVSRKNSKLGLKVRALQNEINQLKIWAGEEGFTTESFIELRRYAISRVFSSLPPIKRKAGRPTSFETRAETAHLWTLFALREDKKLGIKTWLRESLKEDYKRYHVSLSRRTGEIERRVRRLAVRMGRQKPPA